MKLYDTSVRLGRSMSSTLLTPVVPGLLAAVHIDLFYFRYSNWNGSETKE